MHAISHTEGQGDHLIPPIKTRAFTLLEMLIVIGIIALLSALTLPALQGLVGVSGVQGGVNTVLSALDQARAAAIESGTDVYVGFPPSNFTDPADPSTRNASMIVFRGAKPSEPADTIAPLSRWLRLPTGVLLQVENMTLTNLTTPVASKIPKLAGVSVEPLVIRYDRFGRIRTPVIADKNITVGEGLLNGATVQWKAENREILNAQRLTGRWVLSK